MRKYTNNAAVYCTEAGDVLVDLFQEDPGTEPDAFEKIAMTAVFATNLAQRMIEAASLATDVEDEVQH